VATYGSNQGGGMGRVGPVRPSLGTLAQMWPTPDTNPEAPNSSTNRGKNWGGKRRRLTTQGLGNRAEEWATTLAKGWPTPAARDGDNRGADPARVGDPARHGGSNLDDHAALWMTPQAHDAGTARSANAEAADRHHRPHDLQNQAKGWSTPNARDHKGQDLPGRNGSPSLPAQVMQMAGAAGSPQEARPRLNPAFVEALMGFHPGWTGFEPLVTR